MIRPSFLRCALLGVALLCLSTTGVFADDAMSLDDVIACHIDSLGGMDALDATQTLRLEGNMNMGGMEAPMTIEFKRPDKMRMEFTMQGMTGITAFDGETGWSVMPFMGKKEPEKMADDQLKQLKQQSDQIEGFLVNWEEKGYKVEYLGTEEVEGSDSHKVKVVTTTEDEIMLYLDTDYCLIFRQEAVISQMGQEIKVVANIGDYKEVGGILMPHSIEAIPEGAPAGQMITFTKTESNIEIDDSRFTMPETSAEGGE